MNRAGGLLLRLSANGNLNVGTLLGAYLIAIRVSQGIFNAEISILMIGPVKAVIKAVLSFGCDVTGRSDHGSYPKPVEQCCLLRCCSNLSSVLVPCSPPGLYSQDVESPGLWIVIGGHCHHRPQTPK